MKRARFTEHIIGVPKEAEAGAKTADLALRHGVSQATIYNWKSKYGGLGVPICYPGRFFRPLSLS
jgi:putative transposase